MAWDNTMIQLSNISYVSASDVASLRFPIWALLMVLAGLFPLKVSAGLGIVLTIAGAAWLFYWYRENEKTKELRNSNHPNEFRK